MHFCRDRLKPAQPVERTHVGFHLRRVERLAFARTNVRAQRGSRNAPQASKFDPADDAVRETDRRRSQQGGKALIFAVRNGLRPRAERQGEQERGENANAHDTPDVEFGCNAFRTGCPAVWASKMALDRSVLALGYLIIFGSLLGFSAYIWLLCVAPPARVGTYAYVNPVVALVLGWALAGEPITLRTLVASAVIVAAVALVITARQRAAAPATKPAVAAEEAHV